MSKGTFNFLSRGAICSLKHFIWHSTSEKVHGIPGPRASVSFLSWETRLSSVHLGPTCVWCSSIFATLVLFVLWYLIQFSFHCCFLSAPLCSLLLISSAYNGAHYYPNIMFQLTLSTWHSLPASDKRASVKELPRSDGSVDMSVWVVVAGLV